MGLYPNNSQPIPSISQGVKQVLDFGFAGDDVKTDTLNTNMTEEARFNRAAYSGGKLVDATLYSIRRERPCEFMLEGMRFDDRVRWRALDQLKTKKYHVEGMKLRNCPQRNVDDLHLRRKIP